MSVDECDRCCICSDLRTFEANNILVTAKRGSIQVMCGRRPRVKWFLASACGRVQVMCRPVCAVLLTAGPDVIRRSGPNHSPALDSA